MAKALEQIIRIIGDSKGYQTAVDDALKKTEFLQKGLDKIGKASAASFVGLSGVVIATSASFAKFERALVGVGKTTDISGRELQKFGDNIKELSGRIPVAANDLLNIAQTAGQLGVKGTENLQKFTETIARLGFATDLTGEEAAAALTRIINVTNEGIENIDRFGSVIVALGNNFAATESEIARSTNEVARAGAAFGITATDAAALGTVLKSLGVRAEAGGSTIGRAFVQIQKAVNDGGKEFTRLSEVTGIAAENLRREFGENAVGVLQRFLEGAVKLGGGVDQAGTIFAEFGLKGQEIAKVLPVLAGRTDELSRALKLARKEFAENNALVKESETAFKTLEAQFIKTTNKAQNFATEIGENLAPSITRLIESFDGFLDRLAEGDFALAKTIASFVKWGAIITGTIASVTAFTAGVLKLSAGIAGLLTQIGGGAAVVGTFFAGLGGPITLAIAGVTALTVGFLKLNDEIERVSPKNLTDINQRLQDLTGQQKALEAQIKSTSDVGGAAFKKDLEAINKEIARLEDLKQKRLDVSRTQTGPLDFSPAQQTKERAQDITSVGIPSVDRGGSAQSPLRAPADTKDFQEKEVESVQKTEAAKTQALTKEQEKRLAAIKNENEILRAQREGAEQEEIEFLRRRQELNLQEQENLNTQNAELRAAENERLKLEREKLLEDEQIFADEKALRQEERQLEEDDLRRELAEIRRDELTEAQQQELTSLEEKLNSENELEAKAANDRLKFLKKKYKAEQSRRDAAAQAELKLEQAKQNALLNIAKTGTALAAELFGKNAKEIFLAQKLIAAAQVIITSEAAKAAALAPPPIGFGPYAGAPVAAAIEANKFLSLALIAAQTINGIPGAQEGGVVPGVGSGDRTLMALEPGEIVVPKPLTPTFQDQFSLEQDPDSPGGQRGTVNVSIDTVIGTNEFVQNDIIPAISEAVRYDGADLGIGAR